MAKLTASDAASYDYFGYSVAIAGNTIVVGAYRDDDGGSSSGSVYIFHTRTAVRRAMKWPSWTASDAASRLLWLLRGDRRRHRRGRGLLLQAPVEAQSRLRMRRRRDDDELTKLTADDASHATTLATQWRSKATNCGWGLEPRGRPGSAFTSSHSDGGATYQAAMLMADDAASYEQFGKSVALAGGLVGLGPKVRGDPGRSRLRHRRTHGPADDCEPNDVPAPYVRRRPRLPTAAADVQACRYGRPSYDNFGYSVAIDGNTIVVGTRSKRAVYVFRTTDGGATYDEVAKLTASDATQTILAGPYDRRGHHRGRGLLQEL